MPQVINKVGQIIKQIETATVFDSREINALYVNNVGVQIEYTDFSKDGSERKVTEISYEDFCEKIEKHICDLIVD